MTTKQTKIAKKKDPKHKMLEKCQSFVPSSFRISGNAASDKNIKDGVCAQIEKNFVKAKWKVLLLTHLI